MSHKDLFTKKCAACGLTFRTDYNTITVCSTCRKKNKTPDKPKKKPKPRRISSSADISLLNFTRALDRYNRRNNICYSYGQAVSLIDNGIVALKDFMKH